eukprot:CAMPEP_0178993324 /NCGR_PEP_ID=MMETSP0795-20121207/6641_1 /TAXON_ID=88552 /ORGANISM="Amoebophrya sp., Strain Ameob2" /LENGTH=344 /DNA_ID=CAMNT_0020685373 /DNA_START=741 /DNA_END=1775 /DNA_ORIENTATION=+
MVWCCGSEAKKEMARAEGSTATSTSTTREYATATDKILLNLEDEEMHTVQSEHSQSMSRISCGSQTPGKAFAEGDEIPWFSVFHSVSKDLYLETSGTAFRVRNTGYSSTGEKVPSRPAIYTLIGADCVAAKGGRITDIINTWDCKFPRKAAWREEWGVPEILVEHAEIPFKSGHMFSKHPEDDLGCSMVGYYILSDDSIRRLEANQWSVGLRHWKRMVDVGKSDKKGISLKKIVQVRNNDEMDVPKLFKSYNGKPVLVTYSARFQKSHFPRILEIDYDLRQWGYALRSALPTVFTKTPKALIEYALLVEGKSDEELPEQILCCGGYTRLDVYETPSAEPPPTVP